MLVGYDFICYFTISGLAAKERGKYDHALLNVEASDSDMTYSVDCCSELLSRIVAEIGRHLTHHVLAEERLKAFEDVLNECQLKGTKWLLEGEKDSATVDCTEEVQDRDRNSSS